jgi:hypothetical protein
LEKTGPSVVGPVLLDFQAKIHYNLTMTSDTMRFLLVSCFLSMALLAVFFLRKRNLPMLQYAGWGMLAILLPAVGPFLVIWLRPGQNR